MPAPFALLYLAHNKASVQDSFTPLNIDGCDCGNPYPNNTQSKQRISIEEGVKVPFLTIQYEYEFDAPIRLKPFFNRIRPFSVVSTLCRGFFLDIPQARYCGL